MNLLVIGGTLFLGRHTVEAALAAGHDVTLFTRGRTNPDLFPEATRLVGDRNQNLDALADGTWDVVVDTCGYLPRAVRESARMLEPRAQTYVFISSVSVYEEVEGTIHEDTPLSTLEDEDVEEITGATYGPLKVMCERAVQETFGADRALIVRPGLIVGPHDPTDRFTYWPRRVARGGEVLAPGTPRAPVQVIDGRDLGAWIVRLAEQRVAGTFNAVGPNERLTLGEVLEACRETIRPDASFVWIPDEFLLEHDVGPWMELPLWLPESDGSSMMDVATSKAAAAGLTHRPIREIVRDTFEWDAARPPGPRPRGVGLAPEREAEVLNAWRAQAGAVTDG